MDKITEMGKTSATGSVHLFLGVSISTVIMALGTIILGLFILPTDYGLYAVALIPISTISLFQDWGIGSALTRFCAKYRATNEQAEQRKVIMAGLVFTGTAGSVLTVISLLLAEFFAATVYHKPSSAFLISLASVTILSGSLSAGITSIFTGFERMKLNSYLAIILALSAGTTGPLLVYFGYGALGAILGFTIGSLVQCFVAIIFLYLFIIRKLPRCEISKFDIFRTLKALLKYGVPLGLAGIVSSLGSPIFAFLMATFVSNEMIGNYKIAGNFAVLLGFVTTPISMVLFPAFSKVDPQKEGNLLRTVFSSSVKYTNLILIPVAMAIVVLAKPLIDTLYGNKWPYSPFLLSLSAAFYLLSLTGSRSMSSLLTAMGKTRLLMALSILSLCVSIPMAFILVPWLGIIGMIIGLQFAGFPSAFIGLYLTWKNFGAKVNFATSAKILLASAVPTLVIYLLLSFFTATYWILLVVGSMLFFTIYLISAPSVGAIDQADTSNLRLMFSGLGIISKLLEIPLKIIEKLLKIIKEN